MTALSTRLRPASFDAVLGHESISKAIISLLDGPEDKVPHVYTFTGSPGTGKTTLGKIIASHLIPDPDDRTLSMIEVNAADYTGVEDARELLRKVSNRPLSGGNVVVIMDEFHRLSPQAKDVLLKPTEEAGGPGLKHLYWIFCTSEADKIPEALRRRGVLYDLKPVPDGRIKVLLVRTAKDEGWTVPGELRDRIITTAKGSPGMALALLEKIGPMCSENMDPQAIEAVGSQIQGPDEATDNLAKRLLDGTTRDEVRKILAVLKSEGKNPESVRQGVLGYCFAAYTGTWFKDPARALEIMEIFCAGNTYDSGWAGLAVLAANAAGGE